MEDLKKQISEIMNKVQNDPSFMQKFQENPVQAVEGILGVDLPDDQINSVIDSVKAKLTLDNGADLLGKISKLF